MFKTLLMSGAAIVLTGAVARAADIIEPPTVHDWSGPYVGIQGGYGWGENDVEGKGEGELPLEPVLLSLDSDPIVEPSTDGSIGLEGFLGGLHLGHNWQSDSFVFGVTGDLEYSGMDGDTDVFIEDDGELEKVGRISQDIDWLHSLRLRAGLAMDRTLVYVTGGLAVGHVEMESSDIDFGNEKESDTAWGWTLGGGLEYALSEELSGYVEYRYTDLEDTEVDLATPEIGEKVEFENNFHAVRVGLSWHFDGL